MELKTWTRRTNALKAVEKVVAEADAQTETGYFVTGYEAVKADEGWSVKVFCEIPPSEADALQDAIGNAALVVAELGEPVPAEAQPTPSADDPEPSGEAAAADLEQLGEFGLGDNADNAECPHCGINHYSNGWQQHGDEHKCDEMTFACLACGGEWGPRIKRRASTSKQPSLRGQRLAVVGGKDAANPFRPGSKSHATFEMVREHHGATYEELRDMGARMRTITHASKNGWIRAL